MNVRELIENNNPVAMTDERLAKNDLNYTAYAELVAHRDLLSEGQQSLLSHLNLCSRKRKLPGRFHFNASIFVMMGHFDAYNHVCCGQRCKGGRTRCGDPLFCQNCANIQANSFLEKTVTRFDKGHWFFVTLSFVSPVGFESLNMDAAGRYWRVTRDTLKMANILWAGCVYREELVVSGFLPLAIRPHAHLLVFSKESQLNLSTLEQLFGDAARPHNLGCSLSVDSQALDNLNSYLRAVRYLFKPVDLGTLYRKTWAMLGDECSGKDLILKRRQVNSELTDFVHGAQLIRPLTPQPDDLTDLTNLPSGDQGQRRWIYRGVLNPTAKRSLCLSTKQIALARDKIDRILRLGAKRAKRVRKRNEPLRIG